MKNKILTLVHSIAVFVIASCGDSMDENKGIAMEKKESDVNEKAAILKVISDETRAAFNRDYEGWKNKWIHENFATKTYMRVLW